VNDPVDAHVEAYNERDLDRFVACFSPECVIEDARGALVARGHAALRAHFGRVFDEHPELHCEIIHRARVANTSWTRSASPAATAASSTASW
jgi:hypothetical protein